MQHRDFWGQLAGQFYDGIVNPNDWYEGLEGLRLLTEGVMFHQVTWDYRINGITHGLINDQPPPEKVQEYEQHHSVTDPRVPMLMNMPVGSILLDHEHLSPREMSREPVYADWLIPHGYRHSLAVPIYDDGTVREWVCVIREASHQPFGEATHTLLRRLIPDLVRASRLRVHTAKVSAQAAMGLAALDALPQALAVVDADRRIQFLNGPARLALASESPWFVQQGTICAHAPAVQEQLARLIANACQRQGAPSAGSANSGDYSGNTIHVLPLRPDHPLAQVHSERPYALLVWHQPPMSSHSTTHIATALGLTETEARLALMLAQGHTLKEFAQIQGCTWHTARTHARNLLAKTGCRRQAEVSRLVHGLL